MSSEKHDIIEIPRNFFPDNVFNGNLDERREYEQFFWTKETVQSLMESIDYGLWDIECCCLTTPSLAHEYHENGVERKLLDIDERFGYLPRYVYYDVRNPIYIENENTNQPFQLFVLDPPFFFVPIEEFRKAVDILTNKNYKTKLMIGFLKREEKRLLNAFNDYNLKRTNFELLYSAIKPSKCHNFALYSNVDLPGIKRQK